VLAERAEWLGIGLANLLKVYHPPLVILNGIYNAYAGMVGPALQAALAAELEPLGIEVPELAFGSPVVLKADVGAALRAATYNYQLGLGLDLPVEHWVSKPWKI